MDKENNKIQVEKLEESLEGLESLVKRLESDELPLAEALKEFERGIKLTSCLLYTSPSPRDRG